MKSIKLGFLGIGNVGTGAYKIINMNKDKISSATGCDIQIEKILVRDKTKKRDLPLPPSILTEDPADILNNPEIDIVIEVMGGIQPATDYMAKALANGKHVVTANKAAIATNGQLLQSIAKEKNVMLRFEASVGGGIPILNALATALAGNEFNEIIGIVNGTTNYILTQMTEYGLEYADVLKTAQELGFAEPDPTGDVEGLDVANKLSILISLVFGKYISPEAIPTRGITKITKDDINFANQFGYKIKLLATAKMQNKKLECHVQPTLVPVSHPLASVNNEFNAIFIKGNAVDDVMFYGKGAGPLPTGSAVIGDVIDIVRNMKKNGAYDSQPLLRDDSALQFTGEGQNKYYLKLSVEDTPGVLGRISTTLGNYGASINSVTQQPKPNSSGHRVALVLILHEVSRKRLNEAIAEFEMQPYVYTVDSLIRAL